MKRSAQQSQEARNARLLAEAVFHNIAETTGRPPARRGRATQALASIAGWLLCAAILAGVLATFATARSPRQEAPVVHVDIHP